MKNYHPRSKAVQKIRNKLLGAKIAYRGVAHDKTVGMLAEKILDLDENNIGKADLADGKNQPIEVKVHNSDSNTLQTLFTKNPPMVTRSVLSQYSYQDEKRNRRAFYHSFVNGKDSLFDLVMDRNTFELVPKNGELLDAEGNPYRLIWEKKVIREIFEQKLERLFSGSGQNVEYGDRNVFRYKNFGIYYEGFKSRAFWNLLRSGHIVIDFRCHQELDGTIRDHGIAFRVPREYMHRLYEYNEVIRK